MRAENEKCGRRDQNDSSGETKYLKHAENRKKNERTCKRGNKRMQKELRNEKIKKNNMEYDERIRNIKGKKRNDEEKNNTTWK